MVKKTSKTPQTKGNRRVYVIGAGMSGLSTALRLAELGVPVTVFEKNNFVGGMASSFTWGEFPNMDYGPHIFHTPDKTQAEIWEREYGDLFYKNEFWGKNVKGEHFNEFYDYPLSFESLKAFPSRLRTQILDEIGRLDDSRKAAARSYREFVLELVGPTLMEMFFVRYPEKLWGVSVDDMTPNWAPKRVNFHRTRGHFHAEQWNAAGKNGAGAVLNRMAQKLKKAGGEIFLNQGLTAIETSDNRITALVFGNKKIAVGAQDSVVSTMPLPVLAEMLGISNKLQYRGAKLVFIAANKSQAIPGMPSFLYFDDPDIIFHRLSEQKKFSPHGFPKNKTVLTLEIAYTKGDARDNIKDEALIERATNDLIKVGLLKKGEAFDGKVVSLPYVYPLLTKGTEGEVAEVRSRVSAFTQVHLIGTGGDYHYADLQILAVKGRDLAERLAQGNSEETRELRKEKPKHRFNAEVMLGDFKVVQDAPAFIIAEVGLNHNGSVKLAKELIDKAKEVGASAVKFQSYRAESRVSNKVKESRYAEELVDTEESTYAMLKRLEFGPKEHKELFEYAKKVGIPVFSTPFDIEHVELLESLGAPFYKIASMDVVNLPLIKRVGNTGKPVIMSTGMSTLAQIDEAVDAVRSTGNKNLILLQCVSSYPAAAEDMHLRVIETLRTTFGVPVGFSDHAIGLTASSVALSLGASVIERHFTLDRFMEGPDHILSSDPTEFKELVRLSRVIPRIKGNNEKTIVGSEVETINKFKKGLYAKVDIKKGTRITEDMVTIKGPGGAILPKFLDILVGKTVKESIPADYPISWDHFI
jgi:sialic acid synthase SpsE/protoporphyrinogen oxidase